MLDVLERMGLSHVAKNCLHIFSLSSEASQKPFLPSSTTFYFGKWSHLQKSYKNNSRNTQVPLTYIFQLVNFVTFALLFSLCVYMKKNLSRWLNHVRFNYMTS